MINQFYESDWISSRQLTQSCESLQPMQLRKVKVILKFGAKLPDLIADNGDKLSRPIKNFL